MSKIQLLYVKNIIHRKQKKVQQALDFFICLENIHYDKHIDILWAGEDGIWQTLPATYHSMQGNNKEYWQAQTQLILTEQQALAGNIQFSVRYRVLGEEYWDNQQGIDYQSEADSGIKLLANQPIQNIGFQSSLDEDQEHVNVSVAVAHSFKAEKVTLHWTTDHWKTTHISVCQFTINHWDKKVHSNARNPNQYGVEYWTGKIKQGDSFHLQYIICCENEQQTLWENNNGQNYSFQREQLKILILNLHCYQESDQDHKFSQIAKAINELDIDIVCLQEVAEHWNNGAGDWDSNSANIINNRLTTPFHLHTDWSHLGFDRYREGVAILSRYPLFNHQSGYVSDSHDIYNIHSRKVVMAQVHIPYMGVINVFSAHLSWLEDGFQAQFQRLHEWAAHHQTDEVKATLLCGDFNITAGSSGYQSVVDSKHYDDQFLAANQQGVFEKIFKVNDPHWHDLLTDDYRIDYIFMNKHSELQVTSANVLFTEHDYGRVSDHCGYFMTFEPKIKTAKQEETIPCQ